MPIAIVDYDPGWPAAFEAVRAALLARVGGALVDLEHIGSTAVPGLAAKPIVDVMAGVAELADAERCLAPLADLGWEYVPQYELQVPERRYLRKPGYHLHMVEAGGPFWERHLLFRDYLRTHPKQALHYQQLKRVLAARCGDDLAAYAAGKGGFVAVIEDLARQERDQAP